MEELLNLGIAYAKLWLVGEAIGLIFSCVVGMSVIIGAICTLISFWRKR